MIKLGELVMILDLHRQGLSVSAIARQLCIDRKTVRSAIAKGLEPPKYKTRPPRARITDPFEPYLKERLAVYPGLTAVRLWPVKIQPKRSTSDDSKTASRDPAAVRAPYPDICRLWLSPMRSPGS